MASLAAEPLMQRSARRFQCPAIISHADQGDKSAEKGGVSRVRPYAAFARASQAGTIVTNPRLFRREGDAPREFADLN